MPATPPCALVIFGASGDLAKLKLVPAIYELARQNLLPDQFALVGYSRTEMSDDEFRDRCLDAIKTNARSKKDGVDEAAWGKLKSAIYYHPGQYDSADDFDGLKTFLKKVDKDHGTAGNRLFYLSTPPETFKPVITNLGDQGLMQKGTGDADTWQRLVIEKPFGHDLKSAEELNALLHDKFSERQVFRIDHYLGKETVQNLMVLRFANSVFEPIWNHKYIDHVQITVAESVSADDRAGYYDKSGALRDMVQNHLFQLMSLIAMEPPAALDARHTRDEKVKVYQSLRPIPQDKVHEYAVRGQYGAGEFGEGKKTDGYLEAKGVPDDSTTETFAAVKVFCDNWRWSGMPFYLRTGKCLPEKLSEIVIRFRSPPMTLFQTQCQTPVYPNDLIVRVSPDQGIRLRLNGKVPGGSMNIKPVAMDFLYSETFKTEAPEAYERLIADAVAGDQTLFIRGDEAEAAWAVIDPIVEAWEKSDTKPETYKPGTWGPDAADQLIRADGHAWMNGDGGEDEPIIACPL